MTRRKLFGTDGVRGEANSDLTVELALKLGIAAGVYFHENSPHDHRPVIYIARDTRLSGEMIEAALSAGIASMGVDVCSVGVAPTAAISRIVLNRQGAAGVVISASHNPFEDNGIKFFGPDGRKLPDAVEAEIAALYPNWEKLNRALPTSVGRYRTDTEPIAEYVSALKRPFLAGSHLPLSGLRLVMDCANGAAHVIAPALFTELGAEVDLLHASPNGININLRCGSTHPQEMAACTAAVGANAGLAFDGDADRVILSDENGNIVDGDRIMYILATSMAQESQLNNNVVIATIMSNAGLEEALAVHGIHLHRTDVGDRYVAEAMDTMDASIGGEQSGHILLPHLTPTGDGLLTAVHLLSFMNRTGITLSELASPVHSYPQILKNIRVKNREGWNEDPDIMKVISEIRASFKNPQWLSVRPSGTEPLLRVMAQGEDQNQVDNAVHLISEIIQQKLGVA